ncbi:hypothetical protein Ga0100231_005050 [Opitutaceae bacterium TAV4]|nr:hypothetical protein Ga0100231_005050 [Opitutaceae bacterium TAV4]RRK02362.1 hypothetical protein Ga0100230_004190 [Opitutaceae bacterium TAV3]
MKVFKDIEQGTPEWLNLRKGHPTASRFSEVLTATGKLSKQAQGYICELIGETFCPEFEYWKGNAYTERGKELEAEARDAFATHTGLKVEQVGFCLADDGLLGCSPDGLIVGSDGQYVAGVEIKCPTPKTHVAYMLGDGLPDEYRQQVHGSMVVTGLSEWHFWSYFPNMMHVYVIVRRDDYTEALAASLAAFVKDYRAAYDLAVPRLRIGPPPS